MINQAMVTIVTLSTTASALEAALLTGNTSATTADFYLKVAGQCYELFDGWGCDDSCDDFGDWIYEDCSYNYYRTDNCRDDCGYWYNEGFGGDDWWVSCEEFDTWKSCWPQSCHGEMIWEECSQRHYQQNLCSDQCGWWYTELPEEFWNVHWKTLDDYWVSCDEFNSWEKCQGASYFNGPDCYGEWIWEECSQQYYQTDSCRDECGWWYTPHTDQFSQERYWHDDYWVSCDEFWHQDYFPNC